jgi:hypothetical protein
MTMKLGRNSGINPAEEADSPVAISDPILTSVFSMRGHMEGPAKIHPGYIRSSIHIPKPKSFKKTGR